MKNLFFAIIAVSCILSACQSPYVDAPFVPGEGAVENRSGGVPGNVTATQGGKRSIELRWDEVSGAVRYNIFKADSPLTPFVQCAETTETRFNFFVPAGGTVYYRVSAVAYNGQESARSFYVMGSSLAQPVITDITDITEASATVTWYMENVSDATYKANLRYTAYCFDGSTEVAQLAIDGSRLTANRAVFTGLLAGKEYTYQVEAYLVSDQLNSEKSDIMDRETARRFIPGAPEKLTVSRGTSTDKIELSFELPELVNIALGAGEYEMHGIYFVISKRFYSENGNGEYLRVCAYFGADENSPDSFGSYEFGKTVTWTDTSVSRGVEYEYLVQSYVDGTSRKITSDESKASVVGWALAAGTVSIGKPVYISNEDGSLYVSAEVPLHFTFNPKGEEYRYVVMETVHPIEDQEHLDVHEKLDPDVPFRRESDYLNYEQMINYTSKMDLTRKSLPSSPGRGLYSYKVVISLPGGTDIDTLSAIGDVQISEDIHPIIVEGFTVQDGYTDKFRIRWDYYENRKYILFESADGVNWTIVDEYNTSPEDDETLSAVKRTETLTGYSPGQTVYFALQPVRVIYPDGFTPVDKKGQREYLPAAAQTLGVPELQPVTERSYSSVAAIWKGAQKADTYRIKYRYTGDSNWTTAETAATGELSPDTNNQYKKTFKPNGYNDVTKAGKELQIMVEALNQGLRQNYQNETGTDEGEIVTASAEDVKTRLVGPAELAAQASRAADARKIELSWNPAAGADGYYIYRRQFNLNNTYEEGTDFIVYYIHALQEGGSITPVGKNLQLQEGAKTDATLVKAHAGLQAGRYCLTDEYLDDRNGDEWNGAYGGHTVAYREQQNELAWGNPYRYFIVPVLNRDGQPESLDAIQFTYGKDAITQKDTAVTAYSIQENADTIRYTSGAASLEKTGFTIGFGVEVTASKGTKSELGQVEISWTAPPLLAQSEFTPQYIVFRRRNSRSASESSETTWRPVSDSINLTSFTDMPQNRGVAYDYAVGIYPAGGDADAVLDPSSPRFIRTAKERYLDEKERPKMIGFTLASVTMIQVSRSQFDEENYELKDAQGNFGEKVEWYAGGIDGADSYRGNLYDNNWGIDGYEVYVMNRNVDSAWHLIADLTGLPNNTNQNVLVTNVQGGNTREGGLLKVLRDYKHYFKVRSYVIDEQNEKVRCPDPSYTWTNGGQNDYVKWGARQVSTDEYIRIVTLFIANGVHEVNSTDWNTGFFGRTHSANGTGTSGSVEAKSDFGVTSWIFTFTNYREDINTRAGNWVTFITLNGKVWAQTAATNQYPNQWGDEAELTVTGPSDTPNLYTGKASVGQRGVNNLGWGSGVVSVTYPPGTAKQTISYRGEWTPLPYTGRGDNRHQADEWK